MKKLIKKLICKNIIKILIIYTKDIEKEVLTRKNYLNDKIYFEAKHLIKLLEVKGDEKHE